jgi:tRNA (mo5U34)-methyltransferase
VGTFDVVVCGSLMLHLRDPLRALWAIRSVCSDLFLSAETIDLPLTVAHPRRPVFVLGGTSDLVHWSIPNIAGHRQMLRASGFKVESRPARPYTIPYGVSHPARPTSLNYRRRELLQRAVAGGPGVPHSAALARAV